MWVERDDLPVEDQTAALDRGGDAGQLGKGSSDVLLGGVVCRN